MPEVFSLYQSVCALKFQEGFRANQTDRRASEAEWGVGGWKRAPTRRDREDRFRKWQDVLIIFCYHGFLASFRLLSMKLQNFGKIPFQKCDPELGTAWAWAWL